MHHDTERAAIRRHTQDLLASLGTSASAVAAALTEAGVRGLPSNARECAVAVYLGAVISADSRVRSVKVCKSEIQIERTGCWRRSVIVPLPDPVRQFVAAFDARSYPVLLRDDQAAGPGIDLAAQPPVPHPPV